LLLRPHLATIGGIPFTRGPLAHLLRNRFYIGEVLYKGTICPGEQPPILDRDLFEAVQAKLGEQRRSHYATRGSSESLLQGRIFDDRGNRMTPSHSRKQGLRYRYYVSAALIQGQPELVGSITRRPAAEIESLVCAAVGQQFANEPAADVCELVRNHVARVDVTATAITVTVDAIPRRLKAPQLARSDRVLNDVAFLLEIWGDVYCSISQAAPEASSISQAAPEAS
jgi:site-specific DNA recombinase